MVTQTRFKDIIGVGHIALIMTLFIFAFAWYIERKENFKQLPIPTFNGYVTALVLIAIGVLIIYRSFVALPINKRSRCLTRKGPYKFVRHPTYTVIIFCFYPAIALMMKSKAVLYSLIVVYFAFHLLKKQEEKYMKYVFREEYDLYIKQVPPFFPKIYDKKVLRKFKEMIIPHEGTKGYIDMCRKK